MIERQLTTNCWKVVELHERIFREALGQIIGQFFTLWKDADPDVPILIAAKSEYVKLL